MSKAEVATILQNHILEIQKAAEAGERLAEASGGLVYPGHFKAIRLAAAMAAGDLDVKGLVLGPTESIRP